MSRCVSGKIQYATERLAEDALIEVHVKFSYAGDGGPVAVYRCEDCGFFHLTSRGKMNERLGQLIKEKKIQLLKEADHWESKLKGKR
jgi:hypothetical protein